MKLFKSFLILNLIHLVCLIIFSGFTPNQPGACLPEAALLAGPEDDTIVDSYRVYSNFIYLFTDPLYQCWAKKPAGNYAIHICIYCGNRYYSQEFYDAEGKLRTIYGNAKNCPKSMTKCCDNLELYDIGPCKCEGVQLFNKSQKH